MKNTIKKLSLNGESISDIYYGEIYKKHISEQRLGKIHQTSYSLAIDGVK